MSGSIFEVVESDLLGNLTHGMVVCNLTYLVAKELGYDEETCHEISVAGFVHDIGKLQLSQYLYGRNEQSLAVEELRFMRMHSKISYEILKKYDYSKLTLETVLHHHENFDGSGYPDHLRGEDIPFGARVLKVADTFIALISDRPYRKAFDIDEAIQIMIDEVKDFDMAVFIAFQKIVHEESTLKMIKELMNALVDDDLKNLGIAEWQ